MNSRRRISRQNRARQAARENRLFATNGTYPQIPKRLTLQAVSPDNHTFLARYQFQPPSGWKILRCDKELDFLRACGQPQDARTALTRRGFSFSWLLPISSKPVFAGSEAFTETVQTIPTSSQQSPVSWRESHDRATPASVDGPKMRSVALTAAQAGLITR